MYNTYIVKYYATDGQVVKYRTEAYSALDARKQAEAMPNFGSYISVEKVG